MRQPVTDYRRVFLVGTAHLLNDMYGSVITSLTPYLVLRGAIDTAAAGLVVLVYLIGSSVMQPIFGLLSDRSGHRIFAILGPLWVGAAVALFGWVSGPGPLLVVAAIGGIGTAAFHPQAASMVERISGHNRAWVMSLFSMGGNVGYSIGPVLAAAVAAVGLHWSPVLLAPGLALTLLMVLYAPPLGVAERPFDAPSLKAAVRRSWVALALIVTVIAIRSGVQIGFIILLPLFYHLHGMAAQIGSTLAFVLTLSGAAGGLLGGHLADKLGRRPIVVWTLLLSAPALAASLFLPLALAFLATALGGALLLASNAVTVVQAQERLPGSTGIASGLTLGLGFGLSGVINSGLTQLAANIGVIPVLERVPLLALLCGLLAMFIPDVHQMAPQRTVRVAQRA